VPKGEFPSTGNILGARLILKIEFCGNIGMFNHIVSFCITISNLKLLLLYLIETRLLFYICLVCVHKVLRLVPRKSQKRNYDQFFTDL